MCLLEGSYFSGSGGWACLRWPWDFDCRRITVLFSGQHTAMRSLRAARLIGEGEGWPVRRQGGENKLAVLANPGFDDIRCLKRVITGAQPEGVPGDGDLVFSPRGGDASEWVVIRGNRQDNLISRDGLKIEPVAFHLEVIHSHPARVVPANGLDLDVIAEGNPAKNFEVGALIHAIFIQVRFTRAVVADCLLDDDLAAQDGISWDRCEGGLWGGRGRGGGYMGGAGCRCGSGGVRGGRMGGTGHSC